MSTAVGQELPELRLTTESWLSATPLTQPKDKIKAAVDAYHQVGIIGNVIDLMVDFSSEGIDIEHPVPSVQRFFKEWAHKVNLSNKIQQIFLDLYRAGNVFLLWETGQLTVSRRGRTATKPIGRTGRKAKVPLQYQLYDPRSVNVIIDEKTGKISYEVPIKGKLGAGRTQQLPADKVVHLAWRKQDYEEYGLPFTTRILDEIELRSLLFKMLRAAVNGWLSAIRVWKLGAQIRQDDRYDVLVPDQSAFAKLSNILKEHTPGAILDLIWDFAIDVQTIYPPVSEVFGSVPLDTVNRLIKQAMGVPEILVEGSGGGNFATAYLAIKTLVERLEYGRQIVLYGFLEPQLRMITEQLGFREMPLVRFGHMSLRDETAILRLLIQLRDRHLLSKETFLKEFGYDWAIEAARMLREEQQAQTMPELMDVGPFSMLLKNLAGGEQPGDDMSNRGRPEGTKRPLEDVPIKKPRGEGLAEVVAEVKKWVETIESKMNRSGKDDGSNTTENQPKV